MPRVCSRPKFVGLEIIHWQQKLDPFLFSQAQDLLGKMDFVLLHPAGAGGNPQGSIKGISHRASDQEYIRFLHERFNDTDLIRNLRSSQNHQEWPVWRRYFVLQIL